MADRIDVLRAELLGDPEGIGYAGMTDQQALNALKDPVRTTWLDLPPETVIEALDTTELLGKTDAQVRLLTLVLQGNLISSAPGTTGREVIEQIFPAGAGGDNTRAALVAAARLPNQTREQQIGLGGYCTLDRVGRARA